MNDFEITEQSIELRKFTAFISDENENDGGGWNYTAYETDGGVAIEYAGEIETQFLIPVIKLLEYVEYADVARKKPEGLKLSASFHESTEELFSKAAHFLLPVTGAENHNVFVTTTAVADERHSLLRTVTVLRVSNIYQILISGFHVMEFNEVALDATIALLKKFV